MTDFPDSPQMPESSAYSIFPGHMQMHLVAH